MDESHEEIGVAVEVEPSYVTQAGAATGRIHGTNHLVLIVDDMDASVRFYRDLLGFTVVRTTARALDPKRAVQNVRTYFFDIGSADGLKLGLYEVVRDSSRGDDGREPALANFLWPGASRDVVNPRKMDHLAFNVDTYDDLVWFQTHLRAHGLEVSEITVRPVEEFVASIYFYDPSGMPLEIATFDYSGNEDTRGPSHPTAWMRDKDPVPALLGEE